MAGVAGVAVAAEHRGRGAASALMREFLERTRRDGVALSALYPATQPVYRSVGYERAGPEYRIAVQAKSLRGGDRALRVRAATEADEPAIDDVYRRRSRAGCGQLDRVPYLWDRIRRPHGGVVHGYVVEGDAGIEGYVYLTISETAGSPDFDVWCNDLAALTPAAARRLVQFFADRLSVTREVAWRGPPADPLLAVVREQHDVVARLRDVWMLRLVDVPAALAARGYAPGVSAEVHLEVVADDVVPENVGRFVLRVEGGRGEVVRGGEGRVRTDVRGLAALYTAFQGPAELRAAGFVDADDASLAVAAAVFAGAHPWMADHF